MKVTTCSLMTAACAAALAGAPHPAGADVWLRSQEMRDLCRANLDSQEGRIKRAMLLGYLEGMVDSATTAAKFGSLPRGFCLPSRVTAGELRNSVCAYLDARQFDNDLDGVAVAGVAVGMMYPCPK